jgi:hypothetical protein
LDNGNQSNCIGDDSDDGAISMPMMFNSLLAEAGLNWDTVILMRHQDRRADKGKTPFELWRDNREAFERYISIQGFVNRSKFARASDWATFVATPSGETMFVGLYKARYRGVLDHRLPKPQTAGFHEPGSIDIYDLERRQAFEDMDGKLFVEWGDGARAWVQRADRQNKIVRELRR